MNRITVGLFLGSLSLGASTLFIGEVNSQNYILPNSSIVEYCTNPRVFDQEYYNVRKCAFLDVSSFYQGKFKRTVVNNTGGWYLITTPSGSPKGICHAGNTPVHPELSGYRCSQIVQTSVWQNSGGTPVQQAPIIPRVCANAGSNSTTNFGGNFYIGGAPFYINNSTTTYQNGSGCNY